MLDLHRSWSELDPDDAGSAPLEVDNVGDYEVGEVDSSAFENIKVDSRFLQVQEIGID
jgi:hypothetical protein